MPASVITMPEARQAAALYRAGLSQPEVASRMGKSRSAIRTALRLLEVRPRNSSEAMKIRYHRLRTE